MIVLVSLIVLLRSHLVPTVFAWCIPTSAFSRMIFTLVSRIFVKLVHICSWTHAQIYGAASCQIIC